MSGQPERTGYERSAQFYDLFDQKPNVAFFCRYATQAKEILDVGAGTGRIAIALAERGVTVVCVEPSRAMRREFEKKLARQPGVASNIHLISADARSFDAGRAFPVAILSGTFDHFIDTEERRASLANIGRHLVRDGILVFDLFLGLMKDSPLSPAGMIEVGEYEYRRLVGGRILAGSKKETLLVFEVYRDGELENRIEERSYVGLVSREDVHRVLKETGFRVQREWRSYDLAEFQDGDPLLIIEAKKKEENP